MLRLSVLTALESQKGRASKMYKIVSHFHPSPASKGTEGIRALLETVVWNGAAMKLQRIQIKMKTANGEAREHRKEMLEIKETDLDQTARSKQSFACGYWGHSPKPGGRETGQRLWEPEQQRVSGHRVLQRQHEEGEKERDFYFAPVTNELFFPAVVTVVNNWKTYLIITNYKCSWKFPGSN